LTEEGQQSKPSSALGFRLRMNTESRSSAGLTLEIDLLGDHVGAEILHSPSGAV
jgi:hypothetical protein